MSLCMNCITFAKFAVFLRVGEIELYETLQDELRKMINFWVKLSRSDLWLGLENTRALSVIR